MFDRDSAGPAVWSRRQAADGLDRKFASMAVPWKERCHENVSSSVVVILTALILTALLTSLLCGVWFRFVIHRRLELFEGAPAPTGPGEGSHAIRHAPPREAVVHP